MYNFLTPLLHVRDIELIKKIAIKDIEHFLDHNRFFSEEFDPFFGRNLLSLSGNKFVTKYHPKYGVLLKSGRVEKLIIVLQK